MGSDNINRHMTILDHLPVLTHIVNFSLDSGTFLSLWRNAFVISLTTVPILPLLITFAPFPYFPSYSKYSRNVYINSYMYMK